MSRRVIKDSNNTGQKEEYKRYRNLLNEVIKNTKNAYYKSKLEELQLWDTAGQERFRKSMVQHYYRNVHAVVIVYDVTKYSSFQSLTQWIDECNRHNLTANVVPRILVGNKCDCTDKQAVKTNMAQRFADQHNMPLFEISAKEDSECDNVEAIFTLLAHKLKNQRPMMSAPTSPLLANGMTDGLRRADVISVTREPSADDTSGCWC